MQEIKIPFLRIVRQLCKSIKYVYTDIVGRSLFKLWKEGKNKISTRLQKTFVNIDLS